MKNNLSPQELIKRFAYTQNITEEEATALVGGETSEDILNNITTFTKKRIEETSSHMNRAQRRKLMKKLGKKNRGNIEVVSNMAEKLNYIDLIQKLRKLNEQKDKEIEKNESSNENS